MDVGPRYPAVLLLAAAYLVINIFHGGGTNPLACLFSGRSLSPPDSRLARPGITHYRGDRPSRESHQVKRYGLISSDSRAASLMSECAKQFLMPRERCIIRGRCSSPRETAVLIAPAMIARGKIHAGLLFGVSSALQRGGAAFVFIGEP